MVTCAINKIDSNIVGLRYAEEECAKQLPSVTGAVAATGTVTFTGAGTDGDTLTVGDYTFTLRTVPVDDYDVEIGLDETETAGNAAAVITASLQVDAVAALGVITVTAQTPGTSGNTIVLETDSSVVTLSGSTLTGGSDGSGVQWLPLEPNSFADFGGQITKSVRNPISESRQRKKGSTVGVDATGGFNTDLTQSNLQNLLQGFMFADTREKSVYNATATSGDISVTAAGGAFPKLVSTTLDFTTLGLIPGEWIYVGGDAVGSRFVNDENNGFKRIRSISATELVFDKSVAPMVVEAGTGLSIKIYMGKVLKNERTRSLIKKRTYQLERTLGSLDGFDPPQAEYLIGATPNELSITLATEDKITADLGFVGLDVEQRTQAQGLKVGARPAIAELDALNTSSDVARFKLSRVVGTDAVPTPMFSFLQQGTLTINNGVTPLKAIGVFGGFDTNIGDFMVSGSLTAYFSDVAAVQAVRNNEDMTLDMIAVKSGTGIVFDMPLISLGDGRPNVSKDEPITLPLTLEAATAAKLGQDFDYTAMWVFFDELPELASTIV